MRVGQEYKSNIFLQGLGLETYCFITRLLPPSSPIDFLASFQDLARFFDGVGQKAELASDEGAVVRIASPGADVDDVERLIQKGEKR